MPQSAKLKYLLLTEFEGRTVSYGPSFFPSIYGPSAKCAGHMSKGENEDPDEDSDDSEINFIAGYELEDEGHLLVPRLTTITRNLDDSSDDDAAYID